MKENSIVSQIGDALAIPKDYPGINNILNIEEAKKFLRRLESVAAIVDIPDFSPISQEKLELLAQGFNSTYEEWVAALNKLYFIVVLDKDREENDLIIDTCFPANLSEVVKSIDQNGYAKFLDGNRAEFGSYSGELEEVTGTWAEIYLKLVQHIKANLSFPDVPEPEV
jgi:hypothetical protein